MRTDGHSTKYAPMTAAIAPDAPTIGTVELGPTGHVRRRRDRATNEIQQQISPPSLGRFHVVAEHPEEQHVAEQMRDAAVQEHRHEHGEPHVLAGRVRAPAIVADTRLVSL